MHHSTEVQLMGQLMGLGGLHWGGGLGICHCQVQQRKHEEPSSGVQVTKLGQISFKA